MSGLQQLQLKVQKAVAHVDIALQNLVSEKCISFNNVKFKVGFFFFFLNITYDLFHFEEKAHFI